MALEAIHDRKSGSPRGERLTHRVVQVAGGKSIVARCEVPRFTPEIIRGCVLQMMRGIDPAHERYRLHPRTESPFHRKRRYMGPIVGLHPQYSAFAQKQKTK